MSKVKVEIMENTNDKGSMVQNMILYCLDDDAVTSRIKNRVSYLGGIHV